MSVTAAVLHLGNVAFVNNDNDEAMPADAAATVALETAARLLQVGWQGRGGGAPSRCPCVLLAPL